MPRGALEQLEQPGRRWLLVVAAPREAEAVARGLRAGPPGPLADWRIQRLSDRFDLIVSGVGKANAAGATALAYDAALHAGVVNLGIAGALPSADLRIGDAVLAAVSLFADEGLIAPGGFVDLAHMGFGPGIDPRAPAMGVEPDPSLRLALRPIAGREAAVATVSTCSGTDAAAREIAARTGAAAEAMEGAAVGFAAQRLGAPFAEVRIISNQTGDRFAQEWDLHRALLRLTELTALL